MSVCILFNPINELYPTVPPHSPVPIRVNDLKECIETFGILAFESHARSYLIGHGIVPADTEPSSESDGPG